MARAPDITELGAVALTAAYNVAVNRHLPQATHLPANLAASGLLLLLARRAGVTVAGLGLEPDAAPVGVRTGLAVAAGAAGVVALSAANPGTRRLFVDAKVRVHSTAELTYHTLLRIPVATALGEELVFRAALLGLLGRGRSRVLAVALTSGLFGLWHILPAVDSLGPEPEPLSRSRLAGRVASVAGVVVATAGAGAGFAVLRLRSRSVLAPVVAHAVLNSAALLAARFVSRVGRPGPHIGDRALLEGAISLFAGRSLTRSERVGTVSGVPTVLGSRYELRAMLGTGSMARVVEAYDSLLGREVAIKFLRSDAADAEGRARFVREARAAASFVHPHVVTVYDAGEEASRPFLVMELVRGPSLAEVMRARGPLSATESVAISVQMLDALAAAHDLGWLHRDVKPSNVLFVDTTTVKLTDFGLAKSMHDAAGGITRPGQVLGTPMYLAPEQSRGSRTTPSSDLYAVGVVLFQMLTNGLPYSAENLVDLALAHQEAPVPPVLRHDVPDALAVAVARAMAKHPLERYPSARAMQAALLAAVASPQFAAR